MTQRTEFDVVVPDDGLEWVISGKGDELRWLRTVDGEFTDSLSEALRFTAATTLRVTVDKDEINEDPLWPLTDLYLHLYSTPRMQVEIEAQPATMKFPQVIVPTAYGSVVIDIMPVLGEHGELLDATVVKTAFDAMGRMVL